MCTFGIISVIVVVLPFLQVLIYVTSLMMLLISIKCICTYEFWEAIVILLQRPTTSNTSFIINLPAKYTKNKIEHEEWSNHYQWDEKYPVEKGTHSIIGLKCTICQIIYIFIRDRILIRRRNIPLFFKIFTLLFWVCLFLFSI